MKRSLSGGIPTRRNTELALLVLAVALGMLAYAQVSLATDGRLPHSFWIVGAGMGLLVLIAHITLRLRAPYADPILLPAVVLLNLLGLTMIHRLDIADAQRAVRNGTKPPALEVYAQLTWTTLAVFLFIAVVFVVRDHRRLQRFTYISMLLGIGLLLSPLTPGIGATINGATLWLRVAGFSFQPAELAKVMLTIFFAGYLVMKRDSLAIVRAKVLGVGIPRGRDLGPLVVIWFASLGTLFFEHDVGIAALFFGLFVALLYVATERRGWLVIGFIMFLLGGGLAYAAFGHVAVRFEIWWNPWAHQATTGYQLVQSLFALASGGLTGAGLGQGYPQLVPFAKSDFITAAIGEELGLTGLMAILVLYAIIVERGLRTAIASRDPFGTLLAAGLSFVTALQVFLVVGGVTRLIPLTGLTTPFLAAGGSSLIVNWMIIALLLRISDRNRRPQDIAKTPDESLTQVIRL
ncbi:MAG: FtsW/RodA/SpoVE family cell cycle protein [Actinomycetes bacterium]